MASLQKHHHDLIFMLPDKSDNYQVTDIDFCHLMGYTPLIHPG
jgi:hypothetical protein